MLATAAIAIIGHLDGSGATTFIITIITISAMYPIFRKMDMDKRSLLLVICLAIGVMNVMPWGGPTLRSATVLEMDATALWHPLIPVQLLMIALTFIVAFLQAKVMQRKKAHGVVFEKSPVSDADVSGNASAASSLPRWKLYVDYALTLSIIAILVTGKLNSAFVFMVGLAIGLIVNVPNLKEQSAKLKAYSVTSEAVARVLIVAENVGVMISPLSPAVYLGLGMVDLDIGDHIHYSLLWIWGRSIISIIVSIVLGIVPM